MCVCVIMVVGGQDLEQRRAEPTPEEAMRSLIDLRGHKGSCRHLGGQEGTGWSVTIEIAAANNCREAALLGLLCASSVLST